MARTRAATAWLLALLVAGTLLAFGGALANDFVAYDDDVYVTANPEVAAGLSAAGLRWAFAGAHQANWHPLTWLSHMLDVELFGLAPRGHHATSLVLHAANAALFFLFLRRATGRVAPAFFAAALFAWHPLRVESVAWVAERKDVLAGLFFFLTLLAWESFARTRRRSSYACALACFALGLCAKPILVALPLVLLLLARWPLGRSEPWSRLVRETLPFFVLALAASAATWFAQQSAGATASLERLGLAPRLENAVLAVVVYLRQTVWPAGLACLYPHPALARDAGARLGPALVAAAALVALAALTWALFARRRAVPALWTGWAAFLVLLLPVIGIVQVGNQAHADRYTYLPSAALAAGLAFGCAALPGLRARRLVAGLASLALGACVLASARQVGTWKDSLTLFETAARNVPGNYLAHWRLGELRRDRGEGAAAAREFEAALAIRDDLPLVQNELGLVRLEQGDAAAAAAAFERARRLAPREALYGLNLAGAWLAAGEPERARGVLDELARGGEDGAELHFDLGLVDQARGANDAAAAHYRAALERAPDHRDALNNLGQVLLAVGDVDGAVARFERLAQVEPADAVARFNLGRALEARGDLPRAREAYRSALALDPALRPAGERLEALDERP